MIESLSTAVTLCCRWPVSVRKSHDFSGGEALLTSFVLLHARIFEALVKVMRWPEFCSLRRV